MAWKGRPKKHNVYCLYQLRPNRETYMRMRAMAAAESEDQGRDVSMHDVVIKAINAYYHSNVMDPQEPPDRRREEELIEQWLRQEKEAVKGEGQ